MQDNALGSQTVAQIAMVVNNIETAIQRWSALLGMPAPEIILTQPGTEVNATYRGQPTHAQAKLAFFKLGQVQLELIEPVGENSAWKEGLDKNGESAHHIAFWVEGMQRSVDFLKSQGIPMIQRGDMGEGQYAYFDAQESVGIMIELLERKRESRAQG